MDEEESFCLPAPAHNVINCRAQARTYQPAGHPPRGLGRHVQRQLVGDGEERLPLLERL